MIVIWKNKKWKLMKVFKHYFKEYNILNTRWAQFKIKLKRNCNQKNKHFKSSKKKKKNKKYKFFLKESKKFNLLNVLTIVYFFK